MQRRLTGKGIELRRGEQGQTILLIAISIVALLAMAALAIDVVSLYVSKSEIQRAADAVALAGAKAIADSGVTTLPSSDTTDLPTAETLAQNMATSAINAMLSASAGNANLVSGQAPTLVVNPAPINWSQGNNNPTITVTLQQTNLPTFFARIFARTSAIAQATATAEVYNPANLQEFTPVAPAGVKPFLVANIDPVQGCPFVSTTTGVIEPGCSPPMGETFYLAADCNTSQFLTQCQLVGGNLTGGSQGGNYYVQYVPAQVAANPVSCPPCSGSNPYEQTTECFDPNAYAYYQCGSNNSSNETLWNSAVNPYNPNSSVATATECLIHATGTGLGQGQDSMNPYSPYPGSGPPQIIAGSGPLNGQLVTTSNSIVTIPIFDSASVTLVTGVSSPVTIVGFLQAFINSVSSPRDPSDISITVLNIVGCSNTPQGDNPVTGGPGAGLGGASAIPVRLITPP